MDYFQNVDFGKLGPALEPPKPPPPKKSGFFDTIGDYGITALKGAIGVPEAAVGLADIVTGGAAGKLAEDIGFRPKEAKDILSKGYTPEQQAKFQEVRSADGFVDTAAAALRNPSTIAHAVVESAPSMLAGGVVGRGALAVAPKMSPVLAGALGEGTVAAGSAAEQIRQETADGLLTGKQAALAGATGFTTGGLSLVGGKVAKSLGIGDVDTLLAGAARNPGVQKGIVRRVLEGAAAEGVLEELPQSVVEQVLQNEALGKPLDEGVDHAAVMGMLSGGVMGAGANLRSGGITKAMQDVQAKYDAERQQVEQLRQAGDGPGADALEKTIARKVAADGAAVELEALAGDAPEGSFLTQPAFQRQYQGLREAGKTPAEAAAIGALVHRFWETGTQGGMSEKAITKAVEAFRGLPQEKMAQAFESFAATMRQTGGSKADIAAADLQDAMTQGIQAVATSIYGRAASEAETDRILARMEAQAQRDLEGLRDFGDRTPDVVEPMAAAPAASVAPDAAPLPEPAAPVRPEPSAVMAAPPAPAAAAVSPVMDTPEAEAVHQAATSPTNDLPEPSDAQKAAGNYKVGRMRVAGLDISIENPQGSVRRGTSADGTAWETPMQDHYGYFRGTTAADGDKLDVFVKPGTTEDWDGPVFVVDQIDPRTGKLDEHKVVLGAADEAEAETVYRRNYSADWQGLGAITRLPMAAFKAWAKSGKLKEPLGDISQAATQPAAITAPAQADASPAPGGEAVPDAAAPVRAGGADDVQPDPAPVADVETPAAEAAAPAAPPAPFTWTLNPQGTLAVRGDPAQIRARMKAAGVTKMMPMKGGIVVGKTQAELARAALEAGAGQAAPAAEAAAAPPAQPPKAAVAPAPAKQPRPKSKPARDARGAEEARAAYFTPGNIVRGYAGFDEVLEYRAPTQEGGAWSVKVHEVKEVDGEWVRVGKPQDAREHSTQPSAERLREGPHAKVSPAAGPDVPYTAPRADGQPFANAPGRGTAKQSRERPSTDEPAAPASARPSPPAPAEVVGTRPQEAAAARSSPAPKAGAIENFGEQLPPARRALAARLDEELSNDDIANRSLSEIWPLSENEAIEDTLAAAVAHAARAEIPAKPRKPYKLKTWVETVKLLRSLASKFVSGEVTRDRAETMIREKYPRLIDWWSKVQLLEQLPRDQWARVDSVDERPDAITYDDGKKVAAPYLAVSIDGRAHYLRGNGTVAANLEAVRALLQANAPEKRMAFDVFTRKKDGTVFVSKQGDKRPLMEFASVEEARAAVRERYDQLASAWEAVKARDNITERDLRSAENRPRAGKDWRQGKDATPEQFQETFGFRGGEWGKWVAQGKGDKERQALLNSAFDALMDLSAIVGIPPKAISLNGTLGIAFGSRGSGWASAHYEPSNVVINLTKTRGAGALAHEWFHALDNYFSRMRRGGAEAPFNGDKTAYRDENYVTHRPERLMVRKDGSGYWPPMTAGKLEARRKANPTAVQYAAEKWMPDPKHPDGVRPEVEQRFADLVQALNESPMTQRALALDGRKSVGGGYWSSTLERAARAFENYVQARMLEDGYHNDFLANVVPAPDTGRNPERYPYLLPGEVKPIAEAFQTLFSEIKTRETDTGVAMYAMDARMPSGLTMQEARDRIREMRGADIGQVREIVDGIRKGWKGGPAVTVVSSYRDLPGGGTPGARGMYMGGRVWVVASGHRAGPDLQRRVASTLAHEVIAHYGLRKILGADFDRLLTKPLQLAIASGNKPMMALRDEVRGLYRDKNGNYTLDKRAEADEIAARAVEKAIDADGNFRPGYSWLKSVWARVAQFLRDMGISVQFTQAELQGMLVQALRAVESGDRFNGGGRLVVGGDAAAREALGENQTDTPAFRKWFGNSKVVDAEGRPLVVYHGTFGDFDAFDPGQSADGGFHFGTAKAANDRNDYWMDGRDESIAKPNVMPVYLSIKNPKRLTHDPYDEEQWSAEIERAKAEGHDGIAYPNRVEDKGAESWVAFRPEQIKSAIGNSGAFDPTNPDIRYALGEQPRDEAGRFAAAPQEDDPNGPQINRTLRAMVATDLPHRAGNKLTDYRGLGLQFLGRRQLVDIYRDMLPQLPAYSDLVQRMDADKNEAGAGADDLAHRWGKLPDERALAELMHDATLAQIDPSQDFNPTDDEVTYLELRARYGDLSDGAKEIYREARDTYTRHRENVRDAIKQRIERSELKGERKAALLKQMDDEFFKAVRGVYFPLARFGEYVIVTKNADGKTENVSRAETMSEAEATQRALRAAYPAADGYTVGKILKSKEFNAQRDAVGRGFMTELYEVLGDKVGDEKQRAELEDALGQLYLSSLPDLSWAKHGIHRKGTPGFSQDARRAFAQNVFHGARYLAKLRFSDLLQAELTAMQKHVEAQAGNPGYDSVKGQQVVDEMVKRHENLMNPDTNALSTALTSAGFVFHLGLSPASAMVNLSQTALVAYPVMGAKWGWGKASAALMTASQEAIRGKNDISGALNPEERRAYDEAVRSGVIDVTMAHDLAGIAQGEDSKVSWKIRPVMRWAGFLFHHAERFNRSVTFVAAYRLARSAGSNHAQAYRDAVQATYDGHFDYAASNRPRVMQGNVLRVVLLFKQFSQNSAYLLTRQAYLALKGVSPEERAQARQTLAGVLTMHAMAAGVLGLPAVTTLLAAASMIGSSGDEPWDAQVALQNYLADAFGKKPAEVMMRGFSRLTPWDISGRVALDKLLLPDVREGLEGQSQWEAWAGAALGPIGGIAGGIVKGMDLIAEGEYARGLESILPAAIRNVAKSLRYWREDGVLDRTRTPILEDVSPAALVGQAMGFSPSEARNAQEGKSAIMDLDRRLNVRRRLLLSHYTSAVMAEDQDGIAEAREAIDAFNKAQPQRMITARTMAQSVKNRRRRVTEAEQGVYLPKSRRDALEAGRFAMAEED